MIRMKLLVEFAVAELVSGLHYQVQSKHGTGGQKMATEKLLSQISTIERMLGKIEGVAFVLEDKYATPLLDAVEVLDCVLKEIADGK